MGGDDAAPQAFMLNRLKQGQPAHLPAGGSSEEPQVAQEAFRPEAELEVEATQ